MRCDNCGSGENYIKEYKHEYSIKNEKISFVSKRRFCKKCNSLVYDKELDEIASIKGIELYTKKIGIDKDKIIELRKNYGLSIDQFSKIIGCAKKTLISYEKGKSIPNDIYLISMKMLLANPEVITLMVDSNKSRYTTKEYNTIESKISSFQSNNKFNIKIEPSIYNGYTNLSFDKLKNMILILSHKGIFKTKLLKEMFYCDFISYKETGKSITGLEYAKIDLGPVPNNYEEIINELIKGGSIDMKTDYKANYECHIITEKEKFNSSIFNDSELEIINNVKKYFYDYSSKKIVDCSHNEEAFKKTNYYKAISYDYAFDINII